MVNVLFKILMDGFVEKVLIGNDDRKSSDKIRDNADKIKIESKKRFYEAKEKAEKARRLVQEAFDINMTVKNEILGEMVQQLKTLKPQETQNKTHKKSIPFLKQNQYSTIVEPLLEKMEGQNALSQIQLGYKQINSALFNDSPLVWSQLFGGSRISQAEKYFDDVLDFAAELDSKTAILKEAQAKLRLIENTLNSETKLLNTLKNSFALFVERAARKKWKRKKDLKYLSNAFALVQESLSVKITDEQGNVSPRQKEILKQIEVIEKEITCL